MDIINHINLIAGKTIKEAKFDGMNESLCIIFDDDTYAVVVVSQYGDSFDMDISDNLDYNEKEGFGLLTDIEIKTKKNEVAARRKAHANRIVNNEIETLKRLKAKYPDT